MRFKKGDKVVVVKLMETTHAIKKGDIFTVSRESIHNGEWDLVEVDESDEYPFRGEVRLVSFKEYYETLQVKNK